MPANKPYRKRMKRKPRKPKRKTSRRRIIDAGETKLQKQLYDEITHGVLNKNEAATLMSPYTLDQNPAGEIAFPTTWNNLLPGTQALNRNFVSQGTAYNQRVGRRISAQSAMVELQFAFVSPIAPTGTRTYPLYASLRIIHGWCKEGVAGLPTTLTDVPHMYSEIPFSKYKVLSDRTYTRQAQPAITNLNNDVSSAPHEIAVYKPFKIKKRWSPKGTKITFTDSLADVTYAGS